MGRPARNDSLTGAFHVMNRGAGRRRVFFTASDARRFLYLVGEAHNRFGVEVDAFCLMPNHFHLLVECPQGNLSSFMQFVCSAYTREVNERLGSDGAVFRGRFHSLAVTSGEYLDHVARYIHRNPLELADAPRAAEYRWSSYRYYVGGRAAPEWLRTEVVLGMHADSRAYREYVEDDTAPSRAPELVGWAVRTALAECLDEGSAPQGMERTLLAALWTQAPRLRASVETLFDYSSIDARRQAIGRARRRLAQDPTIARAVATAMRLVA